MVWLLFLGSAVIVVIAADRLAAYGDIISVRTHLGGLFVGTIFLAAATSLPEMIASISSFNAGLPDLAAGNFLGSNMVNMLLLAGVDLFHFQVPILRRVAITHALTAVLATMLMLLAVIFILVDPGIVIGWVGIDSILLVALYFVGVWVVQREVALTRIGGSVPVGEPAEDFPTLRAGIIGFLAAAAVLMLVVPQLVASASEIAVITGLGAGFIGTALLSLVTSLPELLAAIAAVRIGGYDMAVGNLLGSSVFNMLALGISDAFYTDGRFLGAIDERFALVGLLALVLTNLALLGNLSRLERRFLFFELDALLILVVYGLGMYLLFLQGVTG